MNRKSKVIVSIVGITIVALALLGITYAYYLTRIEGNTNTNSISITTADLKLVYSENSPEIITENNIMPGTTIGEKKFTVSNTGNSAVEDYKVVLEYAVLEGIVPSVFVRPQDFEITMTCVSKNLETDEETGTCSGYTGTWNNESFEMTLNDIAENIKHEYTLTIFYANPDIDQSDDMGKNLNLKVQIYGANETSTITGTINNVDETYAMKLNSNPKISTIKNVGTKENPKYQYKFIGVEPNEDGKSHKLTLINKSNVEQSTGNITIKKGTNATIDGSTITVKDNQTNIYLTTGSGSTSLTNRATFNPYSDNTNTLAYHIINNSINNVNGTIYRDVPLTKIGQNAIYENGEGVLLEKYISWPEGITYGDSQNEADSGDNWVVGKSNKEKCNNVIGKYISELYSEDSYTYHYNGKVVGCTEEGIPYLDKNSEKTLSMSNDDYGISYYYRGSVEDNYVNFAEMCWRIVRIDGNGNIKLILEDKNNQCETSTGNYIIGSGNFGYTEYYKNTLTASDGTQNNSTLYIMDYLHGETNSNNSMATAFKKFQSTFTLNELAKMNFGNWCLDDKVVHLETYDEYTSNFNYILLDEKDILDNKIKRNYLIYGAESSLNCNGTIMNDWDDANNTPMYVGAITQDEIFYAGEGSVGTVNTDFYLNVNKSSYYYFTLTPYSYTGNYDIIYSGKDSGICYSLGTDDDGDNNFRPSITLKNSTTISRGVGTKTNPYVIAD